MAAIHSQEVVVSALEDSVRKSTSRIYLAGLREVDDADAVVGVRFSKRKSWSEKILRSKRP